MKQQRHLGIVTATREVTQARALITDLYRLVDVLNVDIDFREQEAGVTDLARPEYQPSPEHERARQSARISAAAGRPIDVASSADAHIS
jgi:hypothetical protein